MSFYVGKDRIEVDSIRDAYRVASEIMKDKKLGDSVNVYATPLGTHIEARVEVRPDRNGIRRFVVYKKRNEYGRALTVDYLPMGDRFTNIHQ